jgi:hypothetical protein
VTVLPLRSAILLSAQTKVTAADDALDLARASTVFPYS